MSTELVDILVYIYHRYFVLDYITIYVVIVDAYQYLDQSYASVSLLFFFLVLSYVIFFFFFSSRRRHTRFDCDWSSDVCSSDLDCHLFPGRISGSVLDPVPSRFIELPSFRQHFRGREHAGSDEQPCAGTRLAVAGAVLFHGAARWSGPTFGLHAVDSWVHDVDLYARG